MEIQSQFSEAYIGVCHIVVRQIFVQTNFMDLLVQNKRSEDKAGTNSWQISSLMEIWLEFWLNNFLFILFCILHYCLLHIVAFKIIFFIALLFPGFIT